MAEHATSPQTVSELEDALNQLETSLVDAGRSVALVRRNVAQLATLVDVVREMEAAMNRARLSLGTHTAPIGQDSPPPLRVVPAQEEPGQPPAEPAAPGAGPEASYEPQPTAEAMPEEEQIEAPALAGQTDPIDDLAGENTGAEAETDGEVSHCLRLGVASKVGSLDLKAVDGSVNENPAVVDVALLDYDGRRATLKLWINGMADPVGVRDALLGSLRRRLGDERDADVQIEFEGAA